MKRNKWILAKKKKLMMILHELRMGIGGDSFNSVSMEQ